MLATSRTRKHNQHQERFCARCQRPTVHYELKDSKLMESGWTYREIAGRRIRGYYTYSICQDCGHDAGYYDISSADIADLNRDHQGRMAEIESLRATIDAVKKAVRKRKPASA